jgi:protease II
MKKFKWLNVNKKFFFSKIFNVFKKGDKGVSNSIVQEKSSQENTNKNFTKENQNEAIIDQPHNTDILSNLKDNKRDLTLSKENEMKIIQQKYELYKHYQPTELLKVDKEFGEVVKYSDFLEEGKEKFESVLTKYMEENRQLENNKEFKSLMKLVDEKSKLFYSNYKEEYKYTLQPYEERWYKEAIYSRKTSDLDLYFRKEDPMKRRAPELINRKEKAKQMESAAFEPDHPVYPTAVKTPFETYTDNFQWLVDLKSKESHKFIEFELLYSQHCLYKYSSLETSILEDLADNTIKSKPCALQVSNNHIIFKKNKEDISLYRVDSKSVDPEKRGVIDVKEMQTRGVEIQEVFGLNDFIELNKRFTDLSFLDFAKRLLDNMELERNLLVNFMMCPKEQFLILFFDMNGDMRSFDILIKDIKNNVLLPIVIFNSDGNVAFDHFDGLFYTQVDMTGRPHRVFRHQIGQAQKNDYQFYHERHKEFKVKTYNCNSKEMVYIEVSTNNSQGINVNEIWFKPANDLDKIDFTCIKKMERNINYSVKYSNGAFYMLINKSDTYDKSLKRIRVNSSKVFGLIEHDKVESIKNKESGESNSRSQPSQALTPLSKVKDLTTKQEKENLVDIYQDAMTHSQLIPLAQDLIKIDENINIIDFEIFKNYLVVLEESDKQRRFKIFNLITNNYYIHEPPLEYMNINLIDNLSFESSYFRYLISSPVDPHITVDFSLGTRKAYNVHREEFLKFDCSKYKMEMIYVDDREGEVKIPVLLAYKEDMYNSESPFVLFTNGAASSKKDLDFNELILPLLDKGFVWAVPMIRGTRFFDFNWYSQGIAENKFKHFTDYMDVAFHLKDSGMTNKVILFGQGYSGGLTASVSMIQSPSFYDSTVLLNGAMDVFDLCMNNASNIEVIEEFGDIKVKQFYEMMKLYSPYHTISPSEHCPVLIACDDRNSFVHHSLKFTAKLRRKNKKEKKVNKIFFEILSTRPSEEEKYGFIQSFIIGNTYIK